MGFEGEVNGNEGEERVLVSTIFEKEFTGEGIPDSEFMKGKFITIGDQPDCNETDAEDFHPFPSQDVYCDPPSQKHESVVTALPQNEFSGNREVEVQDVVEEITDFEYERGQAVIWEEDVQEQYINKVETAEVQEPLSVQVHEPLTAEVVEPLSAEVPE